jgi:hypothetical protein
MFVNRNRALLRFIVAEESGGGAPAPEAAPAEAVEVEAPEAEAVEEVTTFDAEKALAKIRKQNQENAALRAAKKVAEEKAQANEKDAGETQSLRAKLMRAEVALELGLPASIAKRLQGDTPEALKADAEELLATMAPKATAPKSVRPVESLQPGSGKSDAGGPAQLSKADLRGMSSDAIEKARVDGRLNDLLGIK